MHLKILLLILANLFVKSQGQADFTCVKDGLFAYNACTQYVQCVYTNTPNALKVLQNCPSGTLFDNSLQVCNWANQVACNSIKATTTSKRVTTPKIPTTTPRPIATSSSKLTTSIKPIVTTAKRTTSVKPIATTVKPTTSVKPIATTGKFIELISVLLVLIFYDQVKFQIRCRKTPKILSFMG
jgi:hypothetical protein